MVLEEAFHSFFKGFGSGDNSSDLQHLQRPKLPHDSAFIRTPFSGVENAGCENCRHFWPCYRGGSSRVLLEDQLPCPPKLQVAIGISVVIEKP